VTDAQFCLKTSIAARCASEGGTRVARFIGGREVVILEFTHKVVQIVDALADPDRGEAQQLRDEEIQF
jgi:hypothetical protein